jgi:5-methylcytosine-specific restriction protein B
MDKDDSEVAVSSGDTWTAAEVESIVAAYLSMLEERLAGRAVNKSHVNRQLRAGALEERSGGAIEYKMQNVSAALADLRLPWIEGYKPAENYQDAIKAEARDTAQSLGLLKTCANQTFREFLAEIENSGLSFEPEFVRAFLVSLATKRFTILTGLSGSGKTQLALQFGRWLGRGRHLVVPVRPDWTGSEALLGYEDALLPTRNGRRAWHVPTAVRFMLRAAGDPWNPYLLLLDEMNLAHVERYFADILSGMESGEPCLPNLVQDDDGHWRLREDGPRLLAFPDNLFVVGTVNVDETTYMFSPKVLDRANTLEFRVRTEDLATGYSRPGECQSGPPELARGFLELSRNHEWAAENPHREQEGIASHLKSTHRLLSESGYEFGHRVFHEALRFSTILQATGEPDALTALDLQILQKVLPRLHGSRRRLEPTLVALARFCRDLEYHPGVVGDGEIVGGDIMDEDANPELPRSFDKLQRMIRALRANQFVSFTE